MTLFFATSFSSKEFGFGFLLLFILFICSYFDVSNASVKLPPNEIITAVIGFGDSIVDAGNNNNIKTLLKANFPPYGEGFNGGYPTGRFSNGKIPTDLLAEELGVKDTVPAYLEPNLSSEELLTGVTFASGGSGYDPLTPKLVSVISLSDQLNYFKEYISKLNAIVGEDRTNFILAKAVFFLVAGSDDIANTYYVLGARKLDYDINSYTDLLANSAIQFMQELYQLGARRIGVFSAPPIGCVPSQRTVGGGLTRDCAENRNDMAKLFNSKLNPRIDDLTKTLPESRMVYIDIYNPLLRIVETPQNYGFQVSNKGCCGTGDLEVAVLCNGISSTTCPNPAEYVFFDSYHPTERAYSVIVSELLEKYIDKFF